MDIQGTVRRNGLFVKLLQKERVCQSMVSMQHSTYTDEYSTQVSQLLTLDRDFTTRTETYLEPS